MDTNRARPGRKHKGDRQPFITRVPRPAAQRVIEQAAARDMSWSEYLAVIIAQAHGVDAVLPEPKREIPQQEELGISA